MSIAKSLQERANAVMVGGVASGWNNFAIYGANHFVRTDGVHLHDVEGKTFLDYCMGWGSLFLGHKPEIIKSAFEEAFNMGFGFQYETEYHIKLAELITGLVPCSEKVRFANSGTEATMFAVRMARSKTGRRKIIKFEGHFHGVNDYLLFAMDSCERLGKKLEYGQLEPIAGSGGIPHDIKELVLPVPYNDTDSFINVVEQYGDDIAGVIMEPIVLASAVIYPATGYLQKIREICTQKGIVLIFDEVMSGFRGGVGGAQETFGVTPDLSTYGKILGCGMPIAAVTGKSEFMDTLSPVGDTEASGTNTGRLYTIVGAYRALSYIKDNLHIYDKVKKLSTEFCNGVNDIFKSHGVPGYASSYAGRTVIHMGTYDKPVNFRDCVTTWNKNYHIKCYEQAYEQGLFAFLLPLLVCPEPITITPAHSLDDIHQTLNIFENIIKHTPYA